MAGRKPFLDNTKLLLAGILALIVALAAMLALATRSAAFAPDVLAEVVSPTSIRFTGEQEMLMSDFGIDPPTAVFGTVRSADEIVIRFDVTFSN